MTLKKASLLILLLLYVDKSWAAFCSDDELAGECFENKVKPMAIAALAIAFVLGISTILLAVALLCKAKRRQKAKVIVRYIDSPRKSQAHKNGGFEKGVPYHVKRPAPEMYIQDPTYVMTRNGAKPIKGKERNPFTAFEDDRSESPSSSHLLWAPATNGRKKIAPATSNGAIYR